MIILSAHVSPPTLHARSQFVERVRLMNRYLPLSL